MIGFLHCFFLLVDSLGEGLVSQLEEGDDAVQLSRDDLFEVLRCQDPRDVVLGQVRVQWLLLRLGPAQN